MIMLRLINCFLCLVFTVFSSLAIASTDLSLKTTAWVGKSDESKSCEKGSGISLAKAAKQLIVAKIKIHKKMKIHDQMAHIQECGADRGVQNGFLIDKTQLEKAKSLGFSPIVNSENSGEGVQ